MKQMNLHFLIKVWVWIVFGFECWTTNSFLTNSRPWRGCWSWVRHEILHRDGVYLCVCVNVCEYSPADVRRGSCDPNRQEEGGMWISPLSLLLLLLVLPQAHPRFNTKPQGWHGNCEWEVPERVWGRRKTTRTSGGFRHSFLSAQSISLTCRLNSQTTRGWTCFYWKKQTHSQESQLNRSPPQYLNAWIEIFIQWLIGTCPFVHSCMLHYDQKLIK